MSWWFKDNHNPSSCRSRRQQTKHKHAHSPWTFVLGGVFVSVLILSSLISAAADSLQKECGKLQHKCLCGVPRCIEPDLVNNGVQDCQDGSDEGQWDPSKCAIKNNTSEDIRFKRAAISEMLRETNGGATTTFFEAERGRTRPVGLLTTTLGSFVTTGTTTEYITKLLATYIKGTYARILSTSSRIYHAIPTDGGDMMDNVIKPTGFIASTVSTEVHGYATTAHTTDFYRTYIDGTYAQLVSSYSNVYFPPWYTDPIMATTVFTGSEESPEQQSEPIYATPVLNYDQIPGSLRTMQVGKFGTIMVPEAIPTRKSQFPEELTGSFVPKNETNFNALAELGLVIGAAAASNENRLRALRPNNIQESEVRVTGTHGNFIHTDVRSGDETTYNVFTGTYIQNAKTFLFFFGNTAIEASRVGLGQGQQTILVENGPQKNSLIVDMTDKLKLVVPAHKDRSTIDGSIAGRHMEGVVVEIESSEGSPLIEDELITVTGATQQTPRDPRIDMVTVTLEKNTPVSKKTRTFSTSSSSSSSYGSKKNFDKIDDDNEIPTGRKVANRDGTIAEAESFLRPTHARPISIPTYTVGQNDNLNYESTTQSEVEVVYNLEQNVEAQVSNGKSGQSQSAPVFQRPKSLYPRVPNGRPGSYRNQKSSFSDANEIDPDLDLQSAASTGRATVTYVGFADFTTTVGNTVIVFMPRTKMIEDLSVQASSTTSRSSPTKIAPTVTRFPTVDPTRYVYTTTTEADEIESTTPKKPEAPVPRVVSAPPPSQSGRLSFGRGGRKSSGSQQSEATSVEISPSETTVLLSGTQTVFTDLDHHDSRILSQQQGVQTILFDSSSFIVEPTPVPPTFITVSSSPASQRNALLRSRQKFLAVEETVQTSPSPSGSLSPRSRLSPYAKSSERSEAEFPLNSPIFRPRVPQQTTTPASVTTNGHSATATTAVYQTDKINPTGLVTSIAGSIVRDSTTTLFTSLVYGTFIGSSYAQVIKSTSTVYYLIPSKSVEVKSPISPSATPVFSKIRPTPAAKFSSIPISSAFSFEVTTTEHSTEPEDESETTTSSSSSSSTSELLDAELLETTTRGGKDDAEEIPTTTGRNGVEELTTKKIIAPRTKSKPEVLSELEKQNEIDRGRKVSGRPQDQVILESTSADKKGRYSSSSRSRGRGSSSLISATDAVIENPTTATPAITELATEDQTIFVTRTVPTTVFRTYTYYTTFYIPKEDDTVTSIISREVTSTAVGFVKKTFSSIIPTSSPATAFDIPTTKATASPAPAESEIPNKKVKASSASLIYKTYLTTYTYLTTFFTGQTSSVSSREEIVSSVVTLTQTGESATRSTITPTSVPVIPATSVIPSPTQEPELETSSSHLVLKTRTRTFTAAKEGDTTVGRGKSPSGKYSIIKRLRSSPLVPTTTLNSEDLLTSPTFEGDLKSPEVFQVPEELSSSSLIPSVVEHTILRTFLTTYTYFTSLFNGNDVSIKTRTEVISNTVPTTVRSTITPIISSSGTSIASSKTQSVDESATTYLTTYTYITTTIKDGTPSESSSVETFSNVVRGDSTIRQGFVTKTRTAEPQPTAIAGRAVQRTNAKNQVREPEHIDDLNEVGSNLSETSEASPTNKAPEATTIDPQSDYYELESSEMTTERSVYNEHEHFDEDSPHKKKMNRELSADTEYDSSDTMATPALKTYQTTFTFYTTFYKGGTSTVSSRLETVTNIDSDAGTETATETPEGQIPPYPITYFTTFTYWTTSFKDKSAIVTSREETVSNIVTPGVDDIAPTTTAAKAIPQVTRSREAKTGTIDESLVVPTATAEIDPEMELTTYFTTFTYYTTSYIGDDTIINSRLETVTNVISATPSATLESESKTSVSPTPSTVLISATAISKPAVVVDGTESQDQDYDLPVGLLSSILNTEVVDKTTTLFSTDVYGTYIDGIYAQVLDSTSKVVHPTSALETKFITGATESATGLLQVNAGKTVEANEAATTFYTTKTYGTIIGEKYAQVFESTSSVTKPAGAGLETSTNPRKTGLVRIIDGSLVKGDKTTYYTSSVLGTIIDNQYAQVIQSTSRYVIGPTSTVEPSVKPTSIPTIIVESSEVTTEAEEIPTTTEKDGQVEEVVSEESEVAKETPDLQSSRRYNGRDRSSRLSFSAPSSKSFSPFITPFASRSRPAFAPKRKQSSAVIVTRTDVTPTVTATLAPTSASRNLIGNSRNSFQNRQKFRRPNEQSEGAEQSQSATPKLPVIPSKSRFQRPRPGASGTSEANEANNIQPTSTSGSPLLQGSSSPGSRGRGPVSRPGSNSSATQSRARGSVAASRAFTATAPGGSSSSGSRGGVSSRYSPQQRQRSSSTSPLSPTRASGLTTVKPTQSPVLSEEDDEETYPEDTDVTPVVTPKTTTQPPSRFGNNRFRLNPRLQTAGLTTTTTRPSTTSRELPFLRRQTFSRPTIPTKGTPAPESPKPDNDDEHVDENEEPKEEVIPVPTQKPILSLKNLIGTSRPTASRASPAAARQRTITTTPIPTPRTTTKRAFAPRQRPAGFPSKGLFRPPTSSEASTEVNDELEHEESQNRPAGLSVPSQSDKDPLESSPSQIEPVEARNPPEKTFEGDVVKVPDLVDSGSHFFESIAAPYESYEYYSDELDGHGADGVLKRTVRQIDYAARLRPKTRSNFRRDSPSLVSSNSNTNSRSSTLYSDYDEYDESPSLASPPATTPTPTTARTSQRFRGRISPTTTSRQTPFTLTNPNSRSTSGSSSRTNSAALSFPKRTQSRYQRPTDASTTTTRGSSRFRSRYRSTETTTTSRPNTRSRYNSSRGRGTSSSAATNSRFIDESLQNSVEMGTITVTHYIPTETTIPVLNGKVTEYKTILTPSTSLEVLAPFQYTRSEYKGKDVLVINSELTATPTFGVTEVTKLIIRETPTSLVTFTPTTIRGRRTSFSHIIPSTVYSVEPVVSTITSNPLLSDNNQLTNLLLNQLLGNLNLNANGLLNLQNPQQQQLQAQPLQQQQAPGETPSLITQYNTKTTSYVTTVTDFTSTVIPITLHGKAIKTTIVESSTNVITATEFITESSIITPTVQLQPQAAVLSQQTLQAPIQNQQAFNPALLQGLIQQQQQLLLKNQQIQATPAAQLVASTTESVDSEESQARKVPPTPPEPKYSVITLYVSGRNPGDFRSILSTVTLDGGRSRRSVDSESFLNPEKVVYSVVKSTASAEPEIEIDNDQSDREYYEVVPGFVALDDSYSYSDAIKNTNTNGNEFRPTQSLDSVLGDVSNVFSQSATFA